jgi:hypothetical protein
MDPHVRQNSNKRTPAAHPHHGTPSYPHCALRTPMLTPTPVPQNPNKRNQRVASNAEKVYLLVGFRVFWF